MITTAVIMQRHLCRHSTATHSMRGIGTIRHTAVLLSRAVVVICLDSDAIAEAERKQAD